MEIQKLQGSSIAQFIKIGDITFMYIEDWYSSARKTLTPGLTHQDLVGIQLTPMAFCVNDEWRISENPKQAYGRCSSTGMALNAINRDKKIRLKRDDFMTEYTDVYAHALSQELHNIPN